MATSGNFIADMFGASTSGAVFVCSLPNADARGSDEPGEQHVITRDAAKVDRFAAAWDRESGASFTVHRR
jgi:hypothetical protein